MRDKGKTNLNTFYMALLNCLPCKGAYTAPATRPLASDCIVPDFIGKPKNILLIPCNAAATLIPSFFPISPNTPTTVSSAMRTAISAGNIVPILGIESDFAMSNNEPNKIRYGCRGMYMSGAGGSITWSSVMRKTVATPLVAGAVQAANYEEFYTSLSSIENTFTMILMQTCDDGIFGVFSRPASGFVDASKNFQAFDIYANQTLESVSDCDMSVKWTFSAEITCGGFIMRPLLDIKTLPTAEQTAWRCLFSS